VHVAALGCCISSHSLSHTTLRLLPQTHGLRAVGGLLWAALGRCGQLWAWKYQKALMFLVIRDNTKNIKVFWYSLRQQLGDIGFGILFFLFFFVISACFWSFPVADFDFFDFFGFPYVFWYLFVKLPKTYRFSCISWSTAGWRRSEQPRAG